MRWEINFSATIIEIKISYSDKSMLSTKSKTTYKNVGKLSTIKNGWPAIQWSTNLYPKSLLFDSIESGVRCELCHVPNKNCIGKYWLLEFSVWHTRKHTHTHMHLTHTCVKCGTQQKWVKLHFDGLFSKTVYTYIYLYNGKMFIESFMHPAKAIYTQHARTMYARSSSKSTSVF